jgi:hypothetical protein
LCWDVRASTALTFLLFLAPAVLEAQVGKPRPARGDSGRGPVDSVESYEKLQADARTRVPVAPQLGAEGPVPASARMIFTRDSIDWSGALTLSDLLARVPGTYLLRAGGIGRPEPLNFAARGAASLEVMLDGMPYRPLGPDSVGVDPADIPLGVIDRVEIERWPSTLRVYLYTRNHDRLASRSSIALAAGPDKLAHYEAFLERRFKAGFGVGAGGDYLKVPPHGIATGTFERTGYWLQASFVPDPAHGVVLEYLGNALNRDEFSDVAASGPRLEGRRGEMRARVFLGGRPDGTGLRLDLLGARSSFDSMAVSQNIWSGGAALTYRAPLLSASAIALLANRWTSLDLSGRVSWTPTSLLVLQAEGAYRRHDGDRNTRWVGGRAGLELPANLELSASARAGKQVAAPAIAASAEQDVQEVEGALGWSTRRLGAEARIARTAAFAPQAYQELPGLAVIPELPVSTWLSAGGYLRPLDWITVRGWYAQASSPAPSGLPPRHWSMTGTIRTNLLRTFRSGAFDLKLELGYEGWRAGSLGLDGSGVDVPLAEAHYVRSLVQVAIESFSIFWESRNLTGEATGYVPGYQVPKFSGMFGVRWGFMN